MQLLYLRCALLPPLWLYAKNLIRATGDKRPVYWLVETFLEEEEARRARAVAQIGDMLPQLQALLKMAGQGGELKAVA